MISMIEKWINKDKKTVKKDDLVADIENIWNEPKEEEGRVVYGEDGQIKSATLNYLIQRLTSSQFQGKSPPPPSLPFAYL